MRLSAFSAHLAVVAAFASSAHAAWLPWRRATVCNGRAELCNRSYGNVTFLGAHDSYAVSADEAVLSADQEIDVPSQLAFGARMLQAQAHKHPITGALNFCHTSCFLYDGGSVLNYLKKVKTFLDANPNEVVTFIFTNPDSLSVKDVWAPVFVSSGIDKLAYVPASNPVSRSSWPTLGQLIDSGKRVIVFLDSGADTAAVPYILPQFQNVWEPPFSVTDPTFPCRVDRIAGPLSTEDHMHMLNHNLNQELLGIDDVLIPVKSKAPTTNGIPSIMANAAGCAPLAGGKAPNFVMLDFVNIGQGLQAVNVLNGVA